MNDKFAKRLNEYLDSECGDYGMSYTWEYNLDNEYVEATIKVDERTKEIVFTYDESNDMLSIELSEDCYYETKEYDWTVKYFWILVTPALFPGN